MNNSLTPLLRACACGLLLVPSIVPFIWRLPQSQILHRVLLICTLGVLCSQMFLVGFKSDAFEIQLITSVPFSSNLQPFLFRCRHGGAVLYVTWNRFFANRYLSNPSNSECSSGQKALLPVALNGVCFVILFTCQCLSPSWLWTQRDQTFLPAAGPVSLCFGAAFKCVINPVSYVVYSLPRLHCLRFNSNAIFKSRTKNHYDIGMFTKKDESQY